MENQTIKNGKVIVITGSTRGIGFGLADSFLQRGCSVAISGRSQAAVDAAATKLSAKYDPKCIFSYPCDVQVFEQVKALWEASKAHFGKIDIWINNAGTSGEQKMVWEIPPEETRAIIDTNIAGLIYGSQVAVKGMLEQGYGAVYNMEGMGSDGRKHNGLSLYGTSKYAVHYFTESLVNETKGKPIIIGALRPGMVITDLITDRYKDRPEDFENAKRIFNIIADRVENVTPWLADHILDNRSTGATISYLSQWKLMSRFVTSRFRKRNVFD